MLRDLTCRRLLAALCGLWLAIVLSEPLALHACALHDGGHGAQHGSAHAVGDHSAPRMSHHSHAPAVPATPPPGHTSCNCIGACCIAAVVVAPAAAVQLAVVGMPRSAAVIATTGVLRRPVEPAHARPPSQAPPRLTT